MTSPRGQQKIPIGPQKKPWVTPAVRSIPFTEELVREILAAQDRLGVSKKRTANR